MTDPRDALRPGERAVETPAAFDAGLWFIGRIETPWPDRDACPKRGDAEAGPLCRIVLAEPWAAAAEGLVPGQRLQALYWMDRARRDVVVQNPGRKGALKGTFALRSPVRPNPVASSLVALVAVDGPALTVRGLDCADGTPLIDLKPDACPHG